MTVQKHLKKHIRTRMEKTGESYTTARRHVLRAAPPTPRDPALRWHFPGNVPTTTCLRIMLAQAGIVAPHTKEPFSEAMLFGLAGGIGMGMFTFFYEKENFASFYIAGRHSWQDDVGYFQQACQRLGAKVEIKESTGSKSAEKQLRDGLAKNGPCIAWVDMALMSNRSMPCQYEGGAYHVVVVYKIDNDHAVIGDLADEPVTIGLPELAKARERIKKQKNRLLWIAAGKKPSNLHELVRGGLQACHRGLTQQRMQNFKLDALRLWGDRLHGSKDKESWERIFAPPRFWTGLTMAHDFIENYGTGGGLSRPLFAEFLAEAGDALSDQRYHALSKRYAELGQAWSDLAFACLPAEVPEFKRAREIVQKRNQAMAEGEPTSIIAATWKELHDLQAQVFKRFPMDDRACDRLRADLQVRVRRIYQDELAALEALADLAN